MFGDKDVSGVPASHDPLRHVETGAREIGMTIHIDHPAYRAAVNAHAKLQTRMLLARATDLDRALRRRFRTGVEDERHAVAGRNFH